MTNQLRVQESVERVVDEFVRDIESSRCFVYSESDIKCELFMRIRDALRSLGSSASVSTEVHYDYRATPRETCDLVVWGRAFGIEDYNAYNDFGGLPPLYALELKFWQVHPGRLPAAVDRERSRLRRLATRSRCGIVVVTRLSESEELESRCTPSPPDERVKLWTAHAPVSNTPAKVSGTEAVLLSILRGSIAELRNRDRDLLDREASERSVTHRLAQYIEARLVGDLAHYHVDCEYNRMNEVPKSLVRRLDQGDDPSLVLPDIVVHRRGESDNLLVVECKIDGSSSQVASDREKLAAYRDPNQTLRYRYSAFVHLHRSREAEVEFEASKPSRPTNSTE